MEATTAGPFADTEPPPVSGCHHPINTKGVIKLIAGLDIFYAMLLIGLHLLSLITRRSALRQHATSTNMTAQNLSLLETLSENPMFDKSGETTEILIWVVMFAICILQLLVAGALYGGTKQREVRVYMRNCRIWAYTTVFLIIVILFQICGIFIQGKVQDHIIRILVCSVEFTCRLIGLYAIRRMKREIEEELCDLGIENQSIYYELQATTPSPVHKTEFRHGRGRPSRRTYHRAEVWDDLDFDEL